MQVIVVDPKFICNPVQMIGVKSALPPLCVNVLVLGQIKPAGRWDKLYFSCRGYFIARRWTSQSWPTPTVDDPFDWITDDDYPLFNVTHCIPMPAAG